MAEAEDVAAGTNPLGAGDADGSPWDGTAAAGTWLELRVSADPEAVDAVSEILARSAPSGVALETPFVSEQEGLVARPLAGAPATLRAYVPALDAVAARRAIDEVAERLAHLQAFGLRPIGELEVRAVHEEDWADAWKAHFPVLRVGRHVVIRPTWREHPAGPDDIVIALDPGMAFGTGLHPTTRLCLVALERLARDGLVAGASVLDVGCGSGVLGIAAGLLDAASVGAIDTDPVAVEATRLNAQRNGVPIEVSRGTLPLARGAAGLGAGPRDLVLANLIAGVLVDLATELASLMRPGDGSPGSGGRMIASGIFRDREPEVRRAFAAAGLRVVRRDVETDWVALDVERVGS